MLIGTGFLFVDHDKKIRPWLLALFTLGVPALALTYSRSSWFAFLLGFLFVGLWIKRDRRVGIALVSFVLIVCSYLAISNLSVRYITDTHGQTVTDRFFESFSYARWASEYYGLGRTYWYVQTPLVVVTASPFFGVGPGQFGGGAAAALHNTKVYEALGLPFGVYGTEGYIDNNWFSLWGEVGTIGVALYVWMFWILFTYSIELYRSSKDPFVRSIAIGYAACILAFAFNGFSSTVFEIRTAAFYFWLYGGFVIALGERGKGQEERV